MRVLVLEDNELLLETLEDFLENEGFGVDLAKDGEEALRLSYKNSYALYLLDIKVPLVDGIELLKELREYGDNTPAIFITSSVDKESITKGYEAGCDEYIKKPFDLDELLMRIKAVLKRVEPEEIIKIDEEHSYNIKRKRLLKGSEEIKINLKDLQLLELLLKNRGQVVTKEMIKDELWQSEEVVSSGALRVYINNLKKIFGKEAIENIRGLGYRFV
jgi:DNA-binding response OmpR family regulator